MATVNDIKIMLLMLIVTHFACKVRAITPDIRGTEALVPEKESVHLSFKRVVV